MVTAAPLLSREEVKAIQEGGIDWFGEDLLIDGVWGSKTAWWAGIKGLPEARQEIVRRGLSYYRRKVQENPGQPNRGPWVDAFLQPGGAGLGLPWCIAFTSYVLREAKVDWPIYHLSALNLLAWAKKEERIVNDPLPGDLFAFMHNSTEGHGGIVLGCDANWICDVDGNVGNRVAVGKRARDGLTFIRTVVNPGFPLVMPPTDKLTILDGPTR